MQSTKMKASTELTALYGRRFGQLPPMAAIKGMSREELDRKMQDAIDAGTPVPEWQGKMITCVVRESLSAGIAPPRKPRE